MKTKDKLELIENWCKACENYDEKKLCATDFCDKSPTKHIKGGGAPSGFDFCG